ncbi:isoprenylcysteine carboxyl methyltransferase [Marinobacterium zhoushanense]|uniref:Isoprenylcysteine carboxyl methyltransferase n=1 Tax=Marinobacterium zhoushanense TaxID=1679163 RepID=A0ABQ1KM27_9GAMM|nr:isoprenylcysteine carboxylmethyltransferase family protein [Marinobacterium zhoushanense]GGC01984.1 isoprenylcysteine carboxyl methyltransferase [Marinobacterium zhoushanense]
MSLELKCPPVLLAAILALLIWGSARLLPLPLEADRLVALVWLKYGLSFTALLIGVLAVVQFRRARTTVHPHKPEKANTLVNSGLYRYSRNPMYLALLLLLTAYTLHEPSWLAPLWLILFVLYMNCFQIRPEERVLKGLFGEEYERYLRRVRRWI